MQLNQLETTEEPQALIHEDLIWKTAQIWSILLPQKLKTPHTIQQALTDPDWHRAMVSRVCIHLWYIFPSKHMNHPYFPLITDFIVHFGGT